MWYLDPTPQSVYIHQLQPPPPLDSAVSQWVITYDHAFVSTSKIHANRRNMQKCVKIISYLGSENMTMDCSCRSRYSSLSFCYFISRKTKQKQQKKNRVSKRGGWIVRFCTYSLFWDQRDSKLSFKTFLSAPLALSSSFLHLPCRASDLQESLNIC